MNEPTLDRDSFRVYRCMWFAERRRHMHPGKALGAEAVRAEIYARWPHLRPEAFDRACEFYDLYPYQPSP